MAKKQKIRIPVKLKTERRSVPTILIKLVDNYKKEIQKDLKPRYSKNLTNKVVWELIKSDLKKMDKNKIINKIPKKYIKNQKVIKE